MTDSTNQRTSPVQLHVDYSDRPVVITPGDEDRFVMSMERAIEACKLSHSQNIVRSDIKKMMEYCRDWASSRPDVEAVYLGPHDFKITVFVVPKSDHFDFDLAEEVARLSQKIRQSYLAVRSEAIEVPGDSLESLRCFVDTDTAAMIYGKTAEPPQKVAE